MKAKHCRMLKPSNLRPLRHSILIKAEAWQRLGQGQWHLQGQGQGQSTSITLSQTLVINPIRSGMFQTANNPRGGFKSPPPPYVLENYCINLHHIIHVHITIGVSGMFQFKFFKNLRFCPFYSDFKMKSSKNNSKNTK